MFNFFLHGPGGLVPTQFFFWLHLKYVRPVFRAVHPENKIKRQYALFSGQYAPSF